MDQRFRVLASRVHYVRSILVFLCLLCAQPAVAGELFLADDRGLFIAAAPSAVSEDTQPSLGDEPPNLWRRNTLIIGSGATLVAAYGLSSWWESGFRDSFETTNEGWFGSDGGIDKLGHAYSNYATMRLLTPLFEKADNDREASVRLATWSTIGIYMGVEILDGFSRSYKFSPEDAIANTAGILLGVALETHADLDAILDFRIDYRPSPESDFDPFGDYSGQKYLVVAKADGFAPLRENQFVRYLEVAVGYGTRGFDTDGEQHRDAYVGLSLNLSRLLADGAYDGRMHSTAFQRGIERLFELVQFPTIVYERRSLD